MSINVTAFFYLLSSVCFIMALQGLSSPDSSRRGNLYGMIGMALAIGTTLFSQNGMGWDIILAGILIGGAVGLFIARHIQMTSLPQLVAAFHSLVGLSAVFVAASAFYNPEAFGLLTPSAMLNYSSAVEMSLGTAIGAITFTGSLIAFGKLQGFVSSKPLLYKGQHILNGVLILAIIASIIMFSFEQTSFFFWMIAFLSFLLGVLLIVPIGGADMPVIVSMLNSYSGWAACGIGFTLSNHLLIITGALVGSSGAILSYIMCKGMNRSFLNVILGGFGGEVDSASQNQEDEEKPVRIGNATDAAFMLKNSQSVIIVPGYGMAVAQAQHAIKEMVEILKKNEVKVRFAIHPVAGRMPGHMNVLLAEAKIPYEDVLELEEINRDFNNTDVALVIGANDVTNPAAKTDPTSPIFGMPILDVEKSGTVLFMKRSLAPGYAGVQNELFYRDNTMMLFGDAKKMSEAIVKELEH